VIHAWTGIYPVPSQPVDPSGVPVAHGFVRAWLERLTPSRFQLVLPANAAGPPVHAPVAAPGERRVSPSPSRLQASDRFQGVFTIRAFKVGQCELPGPVVFRTSPPDDWHLLYFYMILIQGLGKTLVLNPGLPDDLSEINSVWTAIAGERCRVRRTEDERAEAILEQIGLSPSSVDYVLLTPFKTYALGDLRSFPRATVCLSQRGWTEQYLARKYPLPEPEPLSVPDDTFDRLQRGDPNPLKLLRDEDDICPGVRAFRVGVRDRSSMAYVVNTGRGAVVLSDCCFKYENIEQPHPTGVADSLEECLNAYTRMRSEGSTVVPLYDPAVLERFPDGRVA
jgi:hypothetical protein